jgi:hypothetical protein
MYELKQQNAKELESALGDKRKKLKELDRALRDADMDSNVLNVSTNVYFKLFCAYGIDSLCKVHRIGLRVLDVGIELILLFLLRNNVRSSICTQASP